MKAVVAGGSGLLGRQLVPHLTLIRYEVVVLSREPARPAVGNVRYVTWNPDGTAGAWAHEVDGADVVVNLAGAGLADGRWTKARKAVLTSSRVLATRSLVAAVRAASARPSLFIQNSAVGFYGASQSATE